MMRPPRRPPTAPFEALFRAGPVVPTPQRPLRLFRRRGRLGVCVATRWCWRILLRTSRARWRPGKCRDRSAPLLPEYAGQRPRCLPMQMSVRWQHAAAETEAGMEAGTEARLDAGTVAGTAAGMAARWLIAVPVGIRFNPTTPPTAMQAANLRPSRRHRCWSADAAYLDRRCEEAAQRARHHSGPLESQSASRAPLLPAVRRHPRWPNRQRLRPPP